MTKLNAICKISENCEVTMEIDPGTFSLEYLRQIKSLGINRLSMGIQSFDNEALQLTGRSHTFEDIEGAIDMVQKSGIDDYNIDLISSLPRMTPIKWQQTLRKATEIGCSHVSVYDLQIEENTAFGRWYTPGVFPLPTDEQSAQMYRLAVQELTAAGFEHYEISNYALPNRRSRHNQKYWRCSTTWAFGMGAASYVNGRRFTRPGKLNDYEEWVDLLQQKGFEYVSKENPEGSCEEEALLSDAETKSNYESLVPIWGDIELTSQQREDILDVIMLRLRTADGLDLNSLESITSSELVSTICNSLGAYVEGGYVEFTIALAEDDTLIKTVRLTDPEGFLISNDIISSVFAALM